MTRPERLALALLVGVVIALAVWATRFVYVASGDRVYRVHRYTGEVCRSTGGPEWTCRPRFL